VETVGQTAAMTGAVLIAAIIFRKCATISDLCFP